MEETKIGSTFPLVEPVYIKGDIIKGFGRGSNLLGIPTANLPAEKYESELKSLPTGVYMGWATVSGSEPYKAVLSIGDNPYFQAKTKTIEPHIIHKFERDLYGEELKLIILGYIRDMNIKFESLQALIDKIKEDISIGEKDLENERFSSYKTDTFFNSSSAPSSSPATPISESETKQ